jgi:hypothetical protein
MRAGGLGTGPRKLLEEMVEVRSTDVVLPTGGGESLRQREPLSAGRQEIRSRVVGRPAPHLALLLQRLGFPLSNKPRRMQDVVEKIAAKIEKTEQMGRFCL